MVVYHPFPVVAILWLIHHWVQEFWFANNRWELFCGKGACFYSSNESCVPGQDKHPLLGKFLLATFKMYQAMKVVFMEPNDVGNDISLGGTWVSSLQMCKSVFIQLPSYLTSMCGIIYCLRLSSDLCVQFRPHYCFCTSEVVSSYWNIHADGQGTVVVAGRARAVVVGVGSNTAMGSIRDSMLRTEDVSFTCTH